ncbi:hypothetical protein HYZ98_05105 [Candidatus Peregrinibacteria bacterium]|nr:hypothetical protein [Candidatus Peregrinibacteria bacterium]
MPTPPESAPTTPSLTPQEQLESLRTEVQNARNAPPITPDRRAAMQHSLNTLRTDASLDQTELERLDQEIQSLPNPPPAPEPSIEEALTAAGMPLDTTQREQIRQATGMFEKLKKGIFLLIGRIPFLRKWAQTQLKEMGMEEYANELRSPEEKKKAEDEKRKTEEDQRKQEADRRRQLPENIENLDAQRKKAYAFALVKAFNDAAGSEIVPIAQNENEHNLDYARRIGTALAEALKTEQFQDSLALELDPHLEATDTTSSGALGAIFSVGIADYNIHDQPAAAGVKEFGHNLKNDPKKAFDDFMKIDSSLLDKKSGDAVDKIQASLLAAERMMSRDLRQSPPSSTNQQPNRPAAPPTPPTPPVT